MWLFETEAIVTPTPLIIPPLRRLYDFLDPIAFTVLRVLAGLMMMQFGYGKLFGAGDISRDIAHMQNLGLEPAQFWAYFVVGIECFAAAGLILGLLTRPCAVALTILVSVMLVSVLIPRGEGYQLGALWFGAFAYFAVKGGGPISVDRLIGPEF